MAKPKSVPPVQQEIFPPLTILDAVRELDLQIGEVELALKRMREARVSLDLMFDADPNNPSHVQFVDSVTFYKGVLLTLKL